MKIKAVQICNFRSIVDSGWIPLSPDGITVFVGQNESGKTSILEALYAALSNKALSEDDFRIGADLPSVRIRIETNYPEISIPLDIYNEFEKNAVKKFLLDSKNLLEICITWFREDGQDGEFEKLFSLETTGFDELLKTEAPKPIEPVVDSAVSETATVSPTLTTPKTKIALSPDDLAIHIWEELPLAILFNEASGRLPNQVDIDGTGTPTGTGAQAALNFLKIAEINLPDVIKGDRRHRENTLNKANAKVSEDFNSFWSQVIGKSGKLSLKCEIDNYDDSVPGKAGKPHLVFWIIDGNTQLYPKQRSQGVRWFVSFYLQLKASEKSKDKRVFLLDEPGSNLHSRAQGDVLKVINKLGKETSTVIYTTHSPQMLEYPKLFRVHAVQRDGEQDDSPTIVIDAHRLGTASTDTLSPVLTAMGSDLSNHEVIRKTNNVLLEEMSGYYYLTAFWKLTNTQATAYFIAATGVNKIEMLANMFRGWGLDFIVAVDDDNQGRTAYKSMKKELFGDDETLSAKKLLKIPECPSIEDAFSTADFKQYVLNDEKAVVNGTNTEYLKLNNRSKPVIAFQFNLTVESGKLSWKMLDQTTQKKITAIIEAIVSRLV
ncbi:MAG: AAA family ATPase [Pseudomonadota bacterium]